MSSTLKMIFNMNDTGKVTYSLPDPKDGLTKSEVENVMSSIINQEVILVDGEHATAIKDLYIEKVERVDLE